MGKASRPARAGIWARLLLVFAVIGALGGTARADSANEVRIGYQKYGFFTILKAKGSLEQRLAPLGITVKWQEFPAGPQLLEALNVGSIDVGTVGEAPPIFAQAAGADLVYFGHEPPSPAAEALIVPKDSPITSVAQLKGRKVVLNKGSNVHYLLVRALQANGLSIKDIQSVFLPPADARAAFERGAVDAWVIWDPFLAAAQQATGARVLADGTGLVSNHQFYLASRPYLTARPDVIQAILDDLRVVAPAARADVPGTAAILAKETGIDRGALEVAVPRAEAGVQPVDDAVAAEQQRIADSFFELGLIPKAITVRDALPKVALH